MQKQPWKGDTTGHWAREGMLNLSTLPRAVSGQHLPTGLKTSVTTEDVSAAGRGTWARLDPSVLTTGPNPHPKRLQQTW